MTPEELIQQTLAWNKQMQGNPALAQEQSDRNAASGMFNPVFGSPYVTQGAGGHYYTDPGAAASQMASGGTGGRTDIPRITPTPQGAPSLALAGLYQASPSVVNPFSDPGSTYPATPLAQAATSQAAQPGNVWAPSSPTRRRMMDTSAQSGIANPANQPQNQAPITGLRRLSTSY